MGATVTGKAQVAALPAASVAVTETARIEVNRILDDASSPLLPFLDTAFVRELARPGAPVPPEAFFGVKTTVDLVIQLHHWMREYKVALV